MISKTCNYAIKSVIYLAVQREESSKYVGVTQVSEGINSPKAFTAKILQQLSKAGIIDTLRGPNGGFRFLPDKKVSLADIVRVIDGNQLLDGCVLGFKECSASRPCPAHFKFKDVRDSIKKAFTTTDVEEMKRFVQNGNGFLN